MVSKRDRIGPIPVFMYTVFGILALGAFASPSAAADTAPPKIVGASMVDADDDGKTDRLVLVYNERIKHPADHDGRYPFSIVDPAYGIRGVNGASRTKTLVILLREKPAPDPAARPDIKYVKGKPQPVKDLAGNEARAQTYATTIPLPCAANASTDFYANPVVKRAATPAPTGVASPAWCAFPTLTGALAALDASGGTGRIIATGAGSGTAVFKSETFPLAVEDGVVLTTADDPDLGGSGLDPTRYEVRFGGTTPHALELDGGAVKGVTMKSARSADATEMVLCSSGSPELTGVALDGASAAGGEITDGVEVASGCSLSDDLTYGTNPQLGLRVRNFAGSGVDVAAGGSLTLHSPKVHDNGGDGLWIHGSATIEGGQVAFNGDDGVFVDHATSGFVNMMVRDNVASGFEVESSALSTFGRNAIFNNSRTHGWKTPQLLFAGSPTAGVWVWNGVECILGYEVGIDLPDQCDPDTGEQTGAGIDCESGNQNAIFGYDIGDSSETSVGIYAEDGAAVNASANEWGSSSSVQNVDYAAGAVVYAELICGTRGNSGDTSTIPVDYDGF